MNQRWMMLSAVLLACGPRKAVDDDPDGDSGSADGADGSDGTDSGSDGGDGSDGGSDGADIVTGPITETGTEIVICEPFESMDRTDVGEIRFAGDSLELDVGYSGGCEPHWFRLCWDGSFMESDPVAARLLLQHEANGDSCEAYAYETLSFSLIPLTGSYEAAYPGSGTESAIRLLIEGRELLFSF